MWKSENTFAFFFWVGEVKLYLVPTICYPVIGYLSWKAKKTNDRAPQKMENGTQQIAGNHKGEEEGRRGLFVQNEVKDTETQVRRIVVETGNHSRSLTGAGETDEGNQGTQGGNFQKQNSFTGFVSILMWSDSLKREKMQIWCIFVANYTSFVGRLRCRKHTVTINIIKCRRGRGYKLIIKPVVALATYNFLLGFVTFFFHWWGRGIFRSPPHWSTPICCWCYQPCLLCLMGKAERLLTHLRKMTNAVFAASQLIQQVCFHLPVFAY